MENPVVRICIAESADLEVCLASREQTEAAECFAKIIQRSWISHNCLILIFVQFVFKMSLRSNVTYVAGVF